MCFFIVASLSLPVSRINWQIVERTIQTEPAEAAQFTACSPELGWHPRAVSLSQCRWVGACVWSPCDCCRVCFHKKARGSRNRLHGADPYLHLCCQPKPAAEQRSSLLHPSSFKRPALFFPQSKLSPPVHWSRYKPPRWKQRCRLFAAPTAIFSPSTVNINPLEKLQPSYCKKPPNRAGERDVLVKSSHPLVQFPNIHV